MFPLPLNGGTKGWIRWVASEDLLGLDSELRRDLTFGRRSRFLAPLSVRNNVAKLIGADGDFERDGGRFSLYVGGKDTILHLRRHFLRNLSFLEDIMACGCQFGIPLCYSTHTSRTALESRVRHMLSDQKIFGGLTWLLGPALQRGVLRYSSVVRPCLATADGSPNLQNLNVSRDGIGLVSR